ncbi:hypothetical protein [Hoeflea sp. 108]|uniref:hypothetical protein n=1 Tax=Hoeflea sp. 108 TaxID=1116369 RepID=UPI0003798092|nr:hypothetical protein [Hoeflea sp. 108]
MSGEFLPDYSHMPWNGRYRPLFKLFATERWRYVRKDGAPVECDTAGQAIEAAKECVRRILNPTIYSERTAVVEDVLGVAAWHEQRAARAANDQEAVLGAIVVKGRQVKIERRRRA